MAEDFTDLQVLAPFVFSNDSIGVSFELEAENKIDLGGYTHVAVFVKMDVHHNAWLLFRKLKKQVKYKDKKVVMIGKGKKSLENDFLGLPISEEEFLNEISKL